MPLGTGNDLARVLGWGSTTHLEDIPDMLDHIMRASPVKLDRWCAELPVTPALAAPAGAKASAGATPARRASLPAPRVHFISV